MLRPSLNMIQKKIILSYHKEFYQLCHAVWEVKGCVLQKKKPSDVSELEVITDLFLSFPFVFSTAKEDVPGAQR